jgi:Na+/melibiose symporter-like transporter
MTGMGRWKPWLVYGAALIAVLVTALSMHLERLVGWGVLLACFLVGSLGGLGFVRARKQLAPSWSRLSKSGRVTVLLGCAAAVLVGVFVANPHSASDGATHVIGYVVVVLVLWGLYRVFSRVVDAFHAKSGR